MGAWLWSARACCRCCFCCLTALSSFPHSSNALLLMKLPPPTAMPPATSGTASSGLASRASALSGLASRGFASSGLAALTTSNALLMKPSASVAAVPPALSGIALSGLASSGPASRGLAPSDLTPIGRPVPLVVGLRRHPSPLQSLHRRRARTASPVLCTRARSPRSASFSALGSTGGDASFEDGSSNSSRAASGADTSFGDGSSSSSSGGVVLDGGGGGASLNVVVTGANRGLGFAIAERVTRLGHRVVLACRSEREVSRIALLTIPQSLLLARSRCCTAVAGHAYTAVRDRC